MGEGTHTSGELSHPPTPPALDIYANLVGKPDGGHVNSFSQPLSTSSIDPPDCTVFCSPVPNSTSCVHEEQVVDKVDVVQPTCAIIYDGCVQESQEEPTMKGDFLPSASHPLYLDMSCDSATFDFPYENSSLDVATFDHSQDTLNVSLSLHYKEDTYFFENPFNLSSVISGNAESEHPCFSSTPFPVIRS